MAIAKKYDGSKPLREKILYVLSTMEKASAGEVAAEIMELDGISTEDGVADMTVEIEEELSKLYEDGEVEKLREHRQKVRYTLEKKQA